MTRVNRADLQRHILTLVTVFLLLLLDVGPASAGQLAVPKCDLTRHPGGETGFGQYDVAHADETAQSPLNAAGAEDEALWSVAPADTSYAGRWLHLRLTSSFVAPTSAVGLSDDALAFATRADKLDHIFVPEHNLDSLVTQLGSREAVVEQMLGGVSGRTPTAGVFELTTDIAGQPVVVRGAVVDGVVKLGTAFTP